MDRNKRVISRDNLMKHAETVINEVAHSRSLLEIKVRYPGEHKRYRLLD